MRNPTRSSAKRKWAWRDVYMNRSKLGSQVKSWSKEDLKKYRNAKRKKAYYKKLKRKVARLGNLMKKIIKSDG